MKSPKQITLLSFLTVMLHELGGECDVRPDRDIITIGNRIEHEGDSFLTITLPTFGDWILRSLENGHVSLPLPSSFKTTKHGEVRLPAFMSGYTKRMFGLDGYLIDCDSSLIRNSLQICKLFSKIEVECSPTRVEAAFKSFVNIDKEVSNDELRSSPFGRSLRRTAHRLFRGPMGDVDLALRKDDIIPGHGPGSTADSIVGNAKYRIGTWYQRLEPLFPLAEYAIPNHRYWQDLQEIQVLPPSEEIPVKVISVPKTAKTPRIIAMEPAHVQYVQQALKNLIYEAVNNSTLRHLIGFSEQERNQEHARRGSIDGSLATIDLSEASDRVSFELVRTIFSQWPHLWDALQRTRSTSANVLGEVFPLNKFASMGSALCFPVETMVFLTIVVNRIEEELNIKYDPRDFSRWSQVVSVYGDDIVVPSDLATSSMESLESLGLKVNLNKSFIKGKFRESCGHDYYSGDFVTPVKVRSMPPSSRQHVKETISWVETRNQLYRVGLWKTTRWLDDHLTSLLGFFPSKPIDSSAIGRFTYLNFEACKNTKWDKNLHYHRERAWVSDNRLPSSSLDGHAALLKFFITGLNPDDKHLERAGRPRVARMKLGWVHW